MCSYEDTDTPAFVLRINRQRLRALACIYFSTTTLHSLRTFSSDDRVNESNWQHDGYNVLGVQILICFSFNQAYALGQRGDREGNRPQHFIVCAYPPEIREPWCCHVGVDGWRLGGRLHINAKLHISCE